VTFKTKLNKFRILYLCDLFSGINGQKIGNSKTGNVLIT